MFLASYRWRLFFTFDRRGGHKGEGIFVNIHLIPTQAADL